MKFLTFLVFLAISLCSVARAEDALDPILNAKADKVFLQVLSPFCPGRSLLDCPSGKAHDLKEEIRSELKNGKEPNQVSEEIIAKYGEQYRAQPKVEGMGLLAWFAPLVFLGLGALVVVTFSLQRKPRKQHDVPLADPVISDRVAKEIDEALK